MTEPLTAEERDALRLAHEPLVKEQPMDDHPDASKIQQAGAADRALPPAPPVPRADTTPSEPGRPPRPIRDDEPFGPDDESVGDEISPATDEVARLVARVSWLEEALTSVVGELVTRNIVPSDYGDRLTAEVDRRLGGATN